VCEPISDPVKNDWGRGGFSAGGRVKFEKLLSANTWTLTVAAAKES